MTLLPIQQHAVETIQAAFSSNQHKGFILADGCGVGKTAPSIELIKRTPGIKLIIAPSYLMYNWLAELKMWGIDENDVCVIDSGKQIIEKKEIYLTSYSRIINKHLLTQLLKKEYSLVICDEAHALKTWNSQRSNKVLGTFKNRQSNILYKTKNILLLTGTPFLGKIEELYNIVIRIAPGVLDCMGKMEFIMSYAKSIEYTAWGIKPHGIKNEEDLRKRLAPILLRRKNVEGLQPPQHETIRLSASSKELKDLLQLEETFLLEHGITAGNVEALTKLSRIEASKISEVRQKVALLKIPYVLQMIEDIQEETEKPFIIYCWHKIVLSELVKEIKRKYPKLRIEAVDGGTVLKKRHEIVTDFQAKKIDILCATAGSLSEGVNLTAADTVIFIELDYVPKTIEQAYKRLHRRGQESIVRVIKVVFDSGIEKRIIKILDTKQDVIDKVLE